MGIESILCIGICIKLSIVIQCYNLTQTQTLALAWMRLCNAQRDRIHCSWLHLYVRCKVTVLTILFNTLKPLFYGQYVHVRAGRKSSATILAAKRSAGVVLEVNLRNPLHTGDEARKWGNPPWLWNPEQMSPEVQNRVLQFFKKNAWVCGLTIPMIVIGKYFHITPDIIPCDKEHFPCVFLLFLHRHLKW